MSVSQSQSTPHIPSITLMNRNRVQGLLNDLRHASPEVIKDVLAGQQFDSDDPLVWNLALLCELVHMRMKK